jgi:hypothetical protein
MNRDFISISSVHINTNDTTQWPNEKGQKHKQRSIKHTYKTKD